jgi:hypothetical protein
MVKLIGWIFEFECGEVELENGSSSIHVAQLISTAFFMISFLLCLYEGSIRSSWFWMQQLTSVLVKRMLNNFFFNYTCPARLKVRCAVFALKQDMSW